MQQSLPQVLPFSLQQAAQLSLQHFSQVLPAARAVLERVATEAAAMSMRMVFIVLDVLCFEVPALNLRHAAQACACRCAMERRLNWR